MRLLRRPRIDTAKVADRWQPRLYVRLILLALGVGVLGGILLAQLERRRRRRSHQVPEH